MKIISAAAFGLLIFSVSYTDRQERQGSFPADPPPNKKEADFIEERSVTESKNN